MKLPIFLCLFSAAITQTLPAGASDSQPANLSAEWKPLLDASLSQWEIFIGVPHKTVNIPGRPPTQSDDGIHGGAPLGLGNDPLKVFTVIEEEGKPVLHVSGQIFGCVSTKATFENYHLRWQFRWGTKKWPPRETQRRDSGVLIHCFDPHGAFWNCWRNCLECQVMENDCGDFFPLGSTADSTVRPQIAGARAIFNPAGVFCSGAGPVSHGPSVEKPVGEWNTMEVYTIGQTSVFVVNGTVNNVLFNAKRPTPDYSGIEPLTSGYIQVQSEGAEVFYRDIAIQGITEFPAELKQITTKPAVSPVKYAPIATAINPQTTVGIVSDDFYINGKLTYEGRTWNGHRIEGLLMNSRMVQATYDDLNPDTAKRWAYADTGKWDAERNVSEFIAAMPEWKRHGLLAVTVNFQGGSPEGYSQSQPWVTGAFNEDGSLRPEFTARMKRVLDAADANGMVVILGYFYFGQDQRLRDEAAVIRATDEATRWLLDGGWWNVLVEVDNETTTPYHHEILRPARVHELIERVRATEREGRRLLVATSYGGGFVPQENVVRASDFLLLHGNGVTNSARITAMIQETRSVPGYRPMPILFNEDDHENFDHPANNCAAAVAEHVSWGWFDFRRPGEAIEQGYQSPPVNWGISSPRKQAFFDYLGEITGYDSLHTCPQWQTIQPTNACTARHETSMVALHGKLYLLGGRGDKPVEEYDPNINAWRQLAKPPIEINHFQAVVVGECIAVVGAFTGVFPHEQPVPNIWFFDPAKNEWSKGPEIPGARRRGSAGVVVVGDLVYIVGGITEGHWQGFVPWLDTWNIKTGEWKILPDAPRPRDHFQAAVLDGKIIAAGGRTTHGAIGKVFELTIPEVDIFDITKGTWETLPQPLPTPRAGAMVVARGDTLVVAGGESAMQTQAHAQVEAFNLKLGTWTSLPDLQQGRHSGGLSLIGDTLYAVAGSGNSGGAPELNSMEKLDWNAALAVKKSGRRIDLSKFKLTFDDEFNGDQLDTNKWEAPEMPRQGSCRWVKSLVSVHDGALHLGIRLTQDPVYRYDCGAVRTERNYDPSQAMFQQRYGYFETRAKLPKNLKADYWAAFWLMCPQVRYDSISDTREAIEADILESFPLWYKTNLSLSFHWNGYGKKHNMAGIELAPTPELRDGEFHRYGMYWDEHCYVAFYDGREVGRTDLIGFGKKDAGMTPSQGPCQKPCYVKLSCEAAAWAGGDGTKWEKEMTAEDEFVVDYVRVYQGTLPLLP
jgi:beta-glucanase (GH16 family)/N-acetylneuraminic acid mutarotase